MKHWYRYETTEETRKNEFCKFLRRQKFEYQSGGPEKRKLFRSDYNHTGGVLPRTPVFWIAILVRDSAELEACNNWLLTH